MPPEWAPHDGVWIGFPWDQAEWPDHLDQAQKEIVAFANAVCDNGAGERISLVTGSDIAAATARSMVHPLVDVRRRTIGDSWLRDTGCIIVCDGAQRQARNFRFNGWGGKYIMAGDRQIGRILAEEACLPVTDCDWILEGGAIDVDGCGVAVTTKQCLLNPNRNPQMDRTDIEAALLRDLGISRVLWLGEGLSCDHTDGHVDNLARFVAPGHIVIPEASSADDPNAAIYSEAARCAEQYSLKVTRIPSPGYYAPDGEIMPASYANFYIANTVVVVPAFGLPSDAAARDAVAALFPERRAISLASTALLHGGGSFHCCSQQLPAAR